MVTIAHITESIIKRKPYLQEALMKGIINYGALADNIFEEVQSNFDRKIKNSSIMMAIRRYEDKLSKSDISKIKIKKITQVKCESNLIEINIENTRKNLLQIKKIIKKDAYVNIGPKEITVILPKLYQEKILNLFPEAKVIKDLAALTIDFHKKLLKTPGFYYLILRELAWENINLIEINSTKTELNIIIKDDQVGRSYDAINRLIKD